MKKNTRLKRALFGASILIFFIFISSDLAFGQITISSGPDWTDATLIKSLKSSEAYTATTNYNSYPYIASTAWTHSSSLISYRTLLRFELSGIPVGSVVQSAVLYFKSDSTNTLPEQSNSPSSGSNSFYFQKVTQAWNPSTVTWNTQPTTTTTNRVWVGQSTSATEKLSVDIKALVQDMINNPASNYGIMMMLENEVQYRARTYASSNHSIASLQPRLVITLTDPIKKNMDVIFGSLNQSFINTGILTDYGADFADHTLFDGQSLTANNVMDINSWRTLYASLLSSVINPNSNLIHLKTINQRLDSYWQGYDKSDPMVDLPTQFIAYQTLRADAITGNLVANNNGSLVDVAGRSQSPYLTNYVFATAPTVGSDDDGLVHFNLRSSLFVNSSTKSLSSFQVDFDNGVGYQTVTLDIPKDITYSTAGVKNLKFKAQFSDGSVYYSQSNFAVNHPYAAGARYASVSMKSYIFPRSADVACQESFPNPETWQGSYFGATVTVAYSSNYSRTVLCTPQLIKPLIVVEGFDAYKFAALGKANYGVRDFLSSIDNVDGDPWVGNTQELSGLINGAGFDIVFVDFNEGTGDIVRNAYLVENVIKWVNAHKVTNPSTGLREKNVILGQSMGGLVARYATCDMEKRHLATPASNPDHEISKVITQDSPHRGANVPLAFQAMVNDLAPYRLTKIGLATYGIVGAIVGSMVELRDIVPILDQADKLLDEPAAQQMLVVQDGRANSFLDGDYRSMVTMSGTPSFKLVAMSNGSECGVGQLMQPGGELFSLNANFYVNRLVFVAASQVAVAVTSAATRTPAFTPIVMAPFLALLPFTGRNWKINFAANAQPTSGSNQAYTGSFGFQKKILGLFTVNVSLFSGSRSSVPNGLPWDSSPGGYFGLNIMDVQIPSMHLHGAPLIDANFAMRIGQDFSFVPIVSSLDINLYPVTQAALSSPYTNGANTTYPSRFSNFVTQEKDVTEPNGSYFNSGHIQFTGRNADWLLHELQNLTQRANSCTYLCSGTTTSPYISGSTIVCPGSNFPFTLNNVSGASTLQWSTNLIEVSGNGTPVYTIKTTSQANGYVKVNLSGICAQSADVTFNTRSGVPDPPSIHLDEVDCPEYYFSVSNCGVDPSITSYTWQYNIEPSGPVTTYTNRTCTSPRFTFSGTTTSYRVGVQGVNGCGAGNFGTVVVQGCSASGRIATVSTYPNPSTTSVLIALENQANPEETLIEIFDSSGVRLYSKTMQGVGTISVNTENWTKGAYFIKTITRLKTTTDRVIIN